MVKRYLKKDPYSEREQEKYENPIPSRELIVQYLEELGTTVSRKHLIAAFALQDADQVEAMRRRLRAMERDGQVISNRRGQYALIKQLELVRGVVVGRRDGYGFLIPDDGTSDLYLSSYQMRLLFPNDVVLARTSHVDARGRKEGTIVEVLERNTHQVVGTYREEGAFGFIEPEKKDIQQVILIPREESLDAHDGQIVVAEIVTYPTLKRQASGKIVEILGEHLAPGLEIDIAIRSYELPYHWNDDVKAETRQIPETVAESDTQTRTDLRHLSFVTIDGEDAKDFDDAVYCEVSKKSFKLFVAIADVGHYVKPDTALDREALNRGNSVYFPNRVIPMLPEELSNGLCSLKPNVDRLCMVCEMTIDMQGNLKDFSFYNATIQSKQRFTYTQVANMIAGDTQEFKDLAPWIDNLYQLYLKLHAKRMERGALEFETVETRIIFGEGRKIDTIIPVQRNEAHRLIEECMLMANVAAALFLIQHDLPLLYRIHKPPDTEKLENLRGFLASVGLKLPGRTLPTPKDYTALLQKIAGRPDSHIIQTFLLRSLKQALYSPINEGHFGLAYDCYTHFTSPIRRYPDVLVHRAIKHALEKKKPALFNYSAQHLVSLGDHCSMTERRADEATRDVIDWLKCEYMRDKVGEEFDGVISQVTGFGIFVELKNIYVEGLVHITALKNDFYHFDPMLRRLVGKRTNMSYGLGDEIHVQLVRVDLDQKQMDFHLVGLQPEEEAVPKKKTKRKKKR